MATHGTTLTTLTFIALIFIVILLVIERYGLVDRNNITLVRLIIFAFMVNTLIMAFMIISYSTIVTLDGPPGPKGIRGSVGLPGQNDSICINSADSNSSVPYRTLGTLHTRHRKRQQDL